MQKLGIVVFKKLNRSLQFCWEYDELGFERIDLIMNLSEYKRMDTTNCTAAYYKKSREMFLGESELIKQFLMTKKIVFIQSGEQDTSVRVEADGVYVQRTKVNASVGMQYSLTLLNSKIHKERFETEAVMIDVQVVTDNKGIDMPPINLRDYEVVGLLNEMDDTIGDAEYYPLELLKQRYPLEHIETYDYVVVESYEEAVERLRLFREAKTPFRAVDTETTGTHMGLYGDDILTGVVLSYDEGESTYYPFRQDKCNYNLPRSFLSEILKTIAELPESVTVLGYNAKFDEQAFLKERPCYLKGSKYIGKYEPDVGKIMELETYELRVDIDVYALSVLCDPRQIRGLHTLKGRVTNITRQFWLELTDIFKKGCDIRFNVLPPEIIRYYACPDAPNTIKVYNALIKLLPVDEYKILRLESRLVSVKTVNEFFGLRLDQELLARKQENEEYKIKLLGDLFRGIHHTTKNINSSDVRREILYNQLRCPVVVRTNKNQPSTSKVAIAHIVEAGTLRDYDRSNIPPDIKDLEGNVVIKGEELISNRYPSLIMLQKYALATKEAGAYKRLSRLSEGGRFKFYINQVGAGSGRQTSDAHQFSDGMKELVLADSDQHWLWSADYKQIELRILAYLAGQKDLIKLASDPVVDMHRAVLSLITGKPMWAITEEERKKGKTVNFGVVYLMTEYGLAKRLYGPKYTKEELADCKEAIADFYNTLQKVKMLIERNKRFLLENGYIATKMGRRRLFPQLLDPEIPPRKAESLIRAGNNTPVQGFGADLLKIVEVNIQQYIREHGWDALVDCDGVMLPKVRLMLSIHDEVLVSTHKSIPIEEIIKMFKVCMEIEVPGAPPFFSAPAMIRNWYDGKDPAYEVDILFRDQVIREWDERKRSILHPETYLEDLGKFRHDRICGYMDGLIAKYKTVDAVAEHVQHDDLTHTLIELYVPKKERKKIGHTERIHRAVEAYMEGSAADIVTQREELFEYEEGIKDFDTLQGYVHVDKNGELIVERSEDVFEEDETEELVPQETVQEKAEEVFDQCYVQYTLKDVIVDITEFGSLADAEEVNQEIAKIHDAGKYYTVVYLFRSKVIRSGLIVGYDDKEIIMKIVKSALERRGKYGCHTGERLQSGGLETTRGS